MRRIAQWRREKGISQRELARRVGISLRYMEMLESPTGGRKPSLEVLEKIAVALQVRVGDLLDDDPLSHPVLAAR